MALASLGVTAAVLSSANQELTRSNRAEQQARALSLEREQEAHQQRDEALRHLARERVERDRAHFYLEWFLNLQRFGRSLQQHPLYRDFGLRLEVLNADKESISRARIARGEFDRSRPFYLQVETDRDCYLTVFYALPDKGAGVRRGQSCLLVFPNRVERDNWVPKSTPRILLNHPGLFLTPVASVTEPAYLYALATETAWTPEPDGEQANFPTFSPAASRALGDQIAALVGPSAPVPPGRRAIAEEIFIFDVRADRK
jgi:hypothetical protein